MVQPAAPTSCYSCITAPIVNSSPYQLISGGCSAIGGLAQKIADIVTGIFTTIVNFVKYCLCMSSPAATPAPVNPAPAVSTNTATPPATTALPTTTTPAPTSTAHAATSSRPAATTNVPAIDRAVVEAGKQFFLGRVAAIDQSRPQNRFRERLGTEESGRRAFATVFIHANLTLSSNLLEPVVDLINGCAAGPNLMLALTQLNESRNVLTLAQKTEALQIFTGTQGTTQRQPSEAVTALLAQADLIRQQLTQDPVFCAAADAARAELIAPEVV